MVGVAPGRWVCPRKWAWGQAGGLPMWTSFLSADDRICSPPFMELTSLSGDDTMRLLEQNGLAFPFSAYHPRAPLGRLGGPWAGWGWGAVCGSLGCTRAWVAREGQALRPALTCTVETGPQVVWAEGGLLLARQRLSRPP